MELEEKTHKYLILKFACFVFLLSCWQVLGSSWEDNLSYKQIHNTALRHNSAKYSR